jgi:hypothetical protein
VLPYLLLCREDSLQRKHDLRAVFNAVRYVAGSGGICPNDPPRWFVVYQQMQRWLRARLLGDAGRGCTLPATRVGGCKGQPTAMVIAPNPAADARLKTSRVIQVTRLVRRRGLQ